MALLPTQFSDLLEAGTDEAGRGCLAGPVTAAAVILPKDFSHPLLDDSKKLTDKQRYTLRPIIEKEALTFAVAHCSIEEIEELNITRFHQSNAQSHCRFIQNPALIAVDGNRFHPYEKIPHQCVIKGDGKYQNIAAASILAKTYRDDLMMKLHLDYPHYAWDKNKGYPTKSHREGIRENGISPHHRKSFRLLPEQLQIDF